MRSCPLCGEPLIPWGRKCNTCAPADLSTFPGRLDYCIRTSGMMLKNIAADCGVSQGFISDLRGNRERNPSMNTLRKLAEVLKVSPGWLAFDELEEHDD